jgi:hypothetical protein
MRHIVGSALGALVLASASAGAGTAPPLALSATPARVVLDGAGTASVRVTNPGIGELVVDVSRAGFAFDLRGRPKVAGHNAPRAATSWLAVRPARLAIPSGATRVLELRSRLPAGAEPGDHDALVLLTTRPRRGAAVSVRMRIGVVVVVRVPGRIVRRLAIRGVHVRTAQRVRALELLVANAGNVTETLDRTRLQVAVRRGGAEMRLATEARDLRPRTSGVVRVLLPGSLRGWVTVSARITVQTGTPGVRRSFRVKV